MGGGKYHFLYTVEGHVLSTHYWCEKEPPESSIHTARGHYQGNHHRGGCNKQWIFVAPATFCGGSLPIGQVNISELGLVTQSGKVIWGELC